MGGNPNTELDCMCEFPCSLILTIACKIYIYASYHLKSNGHAWWSMHTAFSGKIAIRLKINVWTGTVSFPGYTPRVVAIHQWSSVFSNIDHWHHTINFYMQANAGHHILSQKKITWADINDTVNRKKSLHEISPPLGQLITRSCVNAVVWIVCVYMRS